jgi:hypothetical protein
VVDDVDPIAAPAERCLIREIAGMHLRSPSGHRSDPFGPSDEQPDRRAVGEQPLGEVAADET